MNSSDFIPVSWLSTFCCLSPLYMCRRILDIEKRFWRTSLQWWIIGRKWREEECLVFCWSKYCKLFSFIKCWYFFHIHRRIIQNPSNSSGGVVSVFAWLLLLLKTMSFPISLSNMEKLEKLQSFLNSTRFYSKLKTTVISVSKLSCCFGIFKATSI